MKARIDYTNVKEALRGMYQLEHYIHNSGLEEAPFYSERERAALALTDAVTRITEGHVPDAVFERARAHFNERELIALVSTLTTINAWNRLAITMRTEVGNYQPKARPVSQSA